jgi:alpha-galactosidase
VSITAPAPDVVHLQRAGTSLLVDLREGRLPRILHWGADLGPLEQSVLRALADAQRPTIGDSAVTYPQPVPVVPQLAEGWLGRPGVAGSRQGRAFAPLFADARSELADEGPTARLRTEAMDAASELWLATELELTAEGIVRLRATLRNTGDDPYRVEVLEPALPLPDTASEVLDLSGRWARERVPQRHPLPVGEWVRTSRGGKPGLDHTLVLAVGEHGFGWRRGRVWGVHLGWSGNQALAVERMPAGTRSLRAGELLLPDELVLAPGEECTTPWLYGSWGEGLDEFAERFHRHLRARAAHPRSPRPVLVNTWEAVYFDHALEPLLALAERSAELGAERFVVDDGWFLGRRDDTSSLGDWVVDPGVWPDGLETLAARVKALGMEFGLWFEPEMINLDSELARAHPEWVFDGGHGPGLPSRHQHVLDLGHDEAYGLVRDRMVSLIERLGIDYVKWDHNRYLTDAGHSADGRPGVRRQTLRAYRLMDELRERFPGLEIESCASGGGRIDLGVLERSDRVWPSDCNDPHDRIDIQRWTGLLLPPELQGTHIGALDSHTTHRIAPLDFRAATAFWGHLGIELDLTAIDEGAFARTRAWVAAHRAHRQLLHTGTAVHADTQPEVRVEGVVAADATSALYQFAVLDRPLAWPPERLRLVGLDPERVYEVTELVVGDPVPAGQRPPWMTMPLRASGRALAELGLEAPSLDVDRSVLFSVRAV